MGNTEWPDLPFVPPRSYSAGRPNGQPRLIVVHYTAGSEGPTSAEDGAAYDQRRADGTSAHYYVDQNSIVQCVYTWNRAHTALWNGNQVGIHYELCGTVQSRAQWLDAASSATIKNAAVQMVRDMKKYGIPAVRLTPQQVRAGHRGICGHADVTFAWPEDGGDHTDPGTEFPWDVLMELLQRGGSDVISDADRKQLVQDITSGIRRGSWQLGWLDATIDPAYRGGPTLNSLSTEIAGVASEVRSSRIAVEAMAAAISAGGGSVETAAILAKMVELADADRAREEQLLAQIRELESMLAERDARLAVALTTGMSTDD